MLKLVSAARENASTPRIIAGYRLDQKIGSGAMATVYRARHEKLGRDVALKLVHTQEGDSEVCQRFLREGVTAARVRHPNVVQVLDAGSEGDTAYLAMQLLEGETLAECLKRQGRLPVTYAVDLFLPMCAALMCAHTAGVLHRDLKPANIFLSDVGRGDPEPMLLDFGISKFDDGMDVSLTQNPRFLGTPLYIAPEQADGASGSRFSDQYSLALSLYETLLGVRPFEKYKGSLIQLLRKVAEGEIRPLRELDAGIPEGLDEAVCKALSTDPQARFANLRELGAALLPYASETRRSLWELSFVDAERTMTSANAPIQEHARLRRVQVSVDSSPVPGRKVQESGIFDDADQGDFISHSRMFGASSSEAASTAPASTKSDSQGAASSAQTPSRTGSDSSQRAQANSSRSDSRSLSTNPEHAQFRADESAVSQRLTQHSLSNPGMRPASVPSFSDRGSSFEGARLFESQRRSSSPNSRAPSSPRRNSVGVIIEPPPAKGVSRSVWVISAIFALLALLGTGALLVNEVAGNQNEFYVAHSQIIPSDAQVELDGDVLGRGELNKQLAHDGTIHRLLISHPDFETRTLLFQDRSPNAVIRLKPKAKTAAQQQTPQAQSAPKAQPEAKQQTPVSPEPKQQSSVHKNASSSLTSTASSSRPVALKKSPSKTTSKKPSESSTTAKQKPTPEEANTSPTPPQQVIHTGNLDPWAQ